MPKEYKIMERATWKGCCCCWV